MHEMTENDKSHGDESRYGETSQTAGYRGAPQWQNPYLDFYGDSTVQQVHLHNTVHPAQSNTTTSQIAHGQRVNQHLTDRMSNDQTLSFTKNRIRFILCRYSSYCVHSFAYGLGL